MPLAALAGGAAGGPLLESWGRKKTILMTAFPFMTAGLLVAHAGSVVHIYIGRAMTGYYPYVKPFESF